MSSQAKTLGILTPVGGGDPVPLLKPEMSIGRRRKNDIQLDFENVSGKHCTLRLINGVWHLRDLGSTNGCTLNGQRIANESSILPDDEFGIASHLFSIDYEPSGPTNLNDTNQLLAEAAGVDPAPRHRKASLMELAGLVDEDRPRPRKDRPSSPPEDGPRPSTNTKTRKDDFGDSVPDHFQAPATRQVEADDDFFKMIEEDVREKS